MGLTTKLGEIDDLLKAGNVDEAIAQRSELGKLIEKASSKNPSVPYARAMAADLHLTMFEREPAQKLLSAYFKASSLDRNAVAKAGDALATAAIRSACANTLYRSRKYSEAFDAVRDACAEFEKHHKDKPDDHRVRVGQLWNLAYAARIAWRESDDGTLSQEYLSHCFEEIEHDRREGRLSRERLDSIEAFALDLKSFVTWVRGSLHEAEACATRALLLLQLPAVGRLPAVRDTIRTAHAYLSLGRIFSTSASASSYWKPYELLNSAQKLFDSKSHRLSSMAALERVRVCLKGRNTALAQSELKELKEKNLPADDVLDAEHALTLCWFQQHGEWTSQRDSANRIVAASTGKKLPRRLELEGSLQLGMALTRSPDPADVDEGKKWLEEALAQSEKLHRHRTAVACRLELAVVERGRKDWRNAQVHLDRALALLPQVPSAYLRRRWEEIVGEGTKWIHVVEVDDWDQAREAFLRAFFRVHYNRWKSIEETARRTNAAPPTVNRYLRQR